MDMLRPVFQPLTIAQADAEGAVDRAFNLVQALPIEAHLATGLLLLAGLALWLFGGRLVGPLFAIIGLAGGALVGVLVLPAAGVDEVNGAPATLFGMGIGAAIGLVLALVLLKVAVIFAAGLGFAVAGFLGATIFLEHNPLPAENPPALTLRGDVPRDPGGRRLFTNPYTGEQMTLDQLTVTLREADRRLRSEEPAAPAEGGPDEGPFGRERFEAIALRVRAVLAEAYDAAQDHFNALSARERLVVLGSTLGSMALGLLVGFFLPKRSTAAMTALAGSAIWMASAVWLVDALAPRFSGLTDHSPETWAIVWLIVFLIGLVAQLSGLGRSKGGKKAAGGEKDGDE